MPDLISDQLDPTAPFARLKLSSTGVVGPTPAAATTVGVGAEVAVTVPPVLLAVTAISRVCPVSAVATV